MPELLANDGTNSYVAFCADLGAVTPVWTMGSLLSGVYTKIVGFKGRPGAIALSSPEGNSWTHTWDFTVNNGGWVGRPTYSNYVAGVGWKSASGALYVKAPVQTAAYAITDFSVTFTVATPDGQTGGVTIDIRDNATAWNQVYELVRNNALFQTGGSLVWGPSNYVVAASNSPAYAWAANGGTSAVVTLTNASLSGLGIDPFGGGGGSSHTTIAYSPDYGATWDSIRDAGASPGAVGGFDGARFGPVTVAAAASQVERATAFGGAYSAISGLTETARCLLVPWWKIGSNANENHDVAAPDFFMGGSFGLDKVIGDVATSIDPAVGATIEVANGLTSWKGRFLACLADVSGNRGLFVSTDSGVNWSLIGGANGCADAQSVRVRRHANLPGQLLLACGANGIRYFPGTGTSLVDKSAPSGSWRSIEWFG